MQKNLKLLGTIAILGATLALSGFAIQDAMAANSANKSSFQSASMEVISVQDTLDETGNGLLASASMKASNPTDVLVLYDEECSLYTELNLKGNKDGGDAVEMDEVQAYHTVELWVDENKIGSEITLCDRTYGMSTNILTQIEEICDVVSGSEIDPDSELTCDETFLDSWIKTKSAHGWHWAVVNVGDLPEDGDGLYTFEVRGQAYSSTEDNKVNPEETGVAIGHRTLSVIPIQLDVDAVQP